MKTKTETKIRTVGEVRDEKMRSEAIEDYNNSLRVRIELDRQEYIQSRLREFPQIGLLNSGKFYAFVKGDYVESYFLSRIIDALNAAN
jgi:hypothetical protein